MDFIADSISKQLDNRDLITTEKIIEQFVGMNDDEIKDVYANAIPEFLKYNIIEGDVRSVF